MTLVYSRHWDAVMMFKCECDVGTEKIRHIFIRNPRHLLIHIKLRHYSVVVSFFEVCAMETRNNRITRGVLIRCRISRSRLCLQNLSDLILVVLLRKLSRNYLSKTRKVYTLFLA